MIVTADTARVESHEAVEADFIANPDEAAQAIRLAMELTQQAPPPIQMMMMGPSAQVMQTMPQQGQMMMQGQYMPAAAPAAAWGYSAK